MGFSCEMACDLTFMLRLLAGTAASFFFAVCATVVFLEVCTLLTRLATANFKGLGVSCSTTTYASIIAAAACCVSDTLLCFRLLALVSFELYCKT